MNGNTTANGSTTVPASNPDKKHADWAALFVAALALVVSIWTACQTEREIRESERDRARQERAYLAVEDVRLVQYETGKPWKVAYAIENHGQTPAFDVVDSFQVGVFDAPISSTLERQFATLVDRPGSSTINKQLSRAIVGPALPWSKVRDIAQGRKAFVLLGRVKYKDVFEQPRVVRYCFALRTLVGGEVMQARCPVGNDGT
ncbi:MAG: hypothetical protein V4564_01145 [Pseudomonadota bacterium]